MARFSVIFTKAKMLEIEAEDLKDAEEKARVMEDEYIEKNGVDFGEYPWDVWHVGKIDD